MQDVEERIQHGVDLGKKSGFIKSGQPIVCITGKEIEIIHRLFLKSVNSNFTLAVRTTTQSCQDLLFVSTQCMNLLNFKQVTYCGVMVSTTNF